MGATMAGYGGGAGAGGRFENRLKATWRAGGAALNLWSTIPSAWTAELLATTGYDAITIDMQHGLADYATTVAMLQAIGGRASVLIRLPWNDPALIMRVLDAGAAGVICPLVNSRAEAEALVAACRYPPAGFRSFGPVRAGLGDPLGYVGAGAETAAVIAMIETAEGLERVDEIAAAPGLDGLYVGPADLSLSLGLADVGNFANPALRAALERVLAAAARHGVVPGCHATTPADAALLIGMGFRLTSPASDSALLQAGALAALAVTRESAP